jgi:ABC-type antimicrobial peptide transport system permease subunit
MMYFAHDQGAGFSREYMNLVVRSVGEPLELVPALRTRLAALDRDVPLSNARTMDAVVGGTVASERFGARLLVSFAIIALALAVIGLYGVLGYVVAQRTRELGIRLALGARRAEVFTLVIRRGMTIVLLGLTLGIIAALGTSHLLEGLLFDVSARDPAVFAIVPVVLVLAGLLACALPARRATRVNPVHALKGN